MLKELYQPLFYQTQSSARLRVASTMYEREEKAPTTMPHLQF